MDEVMKFLRAFNQAMDQTLRNWWTADQIEFPPRRFTGGGHG